MNTQFEKTVGNDEWLTPPALLSKLGEFDLDPCSPIVRPWDTAKTHYNKEDLALMKEWNGRVWMNPPYGTETGKWLNKLRLHGNGIALIFARTDTTYFHEYIFNCADAILFMRGRIRFFTVDGKESGSAGAPSALIAYGKQNAQALSTSQIPGKFINLNP